MHNVILLKLDFVEITKKIHNNVESFVISSLRYTLKTVFAYKNNYFQGCWPLNIRIYKFGNSGWSIHVILYIIYTLCWMYYTRYAIYNTRHVMLKKHEKSIYVWSPFYSFYSLNWKKLFIHDQWVIRADKK